MKKHLIILFIASLSFTACKKTEVVPETPDYSTQVIGNYAVSRLDLNGKIAILPANGVTSGIQVKVLAKNRVQLILTVQSATQKTVYNFLPNDIRKDPFADVIIFDNPYLGDYVPSTKRMNLSGVTEAGETIKVIAYN
jgi:hypothetical protein